MSAVEHENFDLAATRASRPPEDRHLEAETLSADGRIARRQKNRERVVDAYANLLRDGVPEPTATEVAESAGVTPRTVYRYMREDSMLKHDVAQRIVALLRSRAPIDERASLRTRIDAYVGFRLDTHDRSAPMMRVVRTHLANDVVGIGVLQGDCQIVREQLASVFAAEVELLDPAVRHAELVAIQTLVLSSSLDYLLDEVEHCRQTAHVVLARHLYAVLADEGAPADVLS